MPSTDFTDTVSLTSATWFDEINDSIFKGVGLSGRTNIAMHATTMDIFALTSTGILDGTGSAVVITAIVNAPRAGARRVLYPITATTITNGATFAVDGAANYVTAAGDALEFEAVTTSTYKVHIRSKSGANVNESRGGIVMHATTMNLWAGAHFLDGTGSAVVITSIVNAPRGGARRVLYPVTGTTITNGAKFDVDGAADYVTAAGDALVFEATSTSTFKVHITRKDGKAVINTQQTRQVFTSGTGATYTTPTRCTRINIRMVGGGAGGGGATANNGTVGNNTTFSTLTASGGGAGLANNGTPTAAGGAASGGDINIPGGGGTGGGVASSGTSISGGQGGGSVFGGGGGGGSGNNNGTVGGANSGGGGGGGGGSNTNAGGGGGSGGYVEKLIVAPAATYLYTVGAAASGGAAGTTAGGNGAAGIIIVDEFYD